MCKKNCVLKQSKCAGLKKKKECKFLALSLLMTIICGQIRSVLPIECEP